MSLVVGAWLEPLPGLDLRLALEILPWPLAISADDQVPSAPESALRLRLGMGWIGNLRGE